MHRTTVLYKLQYGLANTFCLQLTDHLQTTTYSLNVDEATSKNHMHVFTVLVSYYDRSAKKVKVEQLVSLNVPAVDASVPYAEVCALQKCFELLWQNLLAMLMDSASVMRGHKSGVEIRICEEVAPHLVDIDDDVCHHVHKITKKFCSYFENYVENLFRQIYTDFATSADSLEILKEITYHLWMTFRKPVNYIATRWLSILDTSPAFSYMAFAYVLCYQPMIAKMTDDKLKQIYKTYKKNLRDEKTEERRTKLVKRKEYIKACNEKILKVFQWNHCKLSEKLKNWR